MIRIIPVSRLCKQCMSPLAPMHGIRLLDRSTHAPAASLSNAEASDEALKWRKDYRLTGEGSRNHCKVVTEDGYTIQSDIPKSMGGRDSAPQPVYLLLAALTGCETATANYVGERKLIHVCHSFLRLHQKLFAKTSSLHDMLYFIIWPTYAQLDK